MFHDPAHKAWTSDILCPEGTTIFCDQWKLGYLWVFFFLISSNPSDYYNPPKDLTTDRKHYMPQVFGATCALAELSCWLPLQTLPRRIPEDWIQPFTWFYSALIFKKSAETQSCLILLAFHQIFLKLASGLKALQVHTQITHGYRRSFSLERVEEEEKNPTNPS